MTLFSQNYKDAQIQSSSKRFQKNKSSRARRDRKTLHRHKKGFFRSPVDKHLKRKFAYYKEQKGHPVGENQQRVSSFFQSKPV